MADRVVLVMAKQGRTATSPARSTSSGATRSTAAIGAAIGDFPFLHFEACYYRAIDFAIARGLKRVEAGAQGQHKIQRGYLALPHLQRALDQGQ